MAVAIYARKSTEQTGVADEDNSVTRLRPALSGDRAERCGNSGETQSKKGGTHGQSLQA